MLKYIQKLFDKWMNGCRNAETPSASITDDTFYSYYTPLAFKKDGTMWLNCSKYSATTSRQQFCLRALANQYGLKLIELERDEFRKLWRETV